MHWRRTARIITIGFRLAVLRLRSALVVPDVAMCLLSQLWSTARVVVGMRPRIRPGEDSVSHRSRSPRVAPALLVVIGALAAGVMPSVAASSASTTTRATKITFSKSPVGGPSERARGYATIRAPANWSRRRVGDQVEFGAHLSPTCKLTISVGAFTGDASTPSRQLRRQLNPRNGGTIQTGKMSHRDGVWGVQIEGAGPGFQLLGGAVVKLAKRRMAQLSVQVVAAPECAPTDGPAAHGSIKHLLRTARIHARIVSAKPLR